MGNLQHVDSENEKLEDQVALRESCLYGGKSEALLANSWMARSSSLICSKVNGA